MLSKCIIALVDFCQTSLLVLVFFWALPSLTTSVKVDCPENRNDCPQTAELYKVMEKARARPADIGYKGFNSEESSYKELFYYDDNGDLTFNGWNQGISPPIPLFQNKTGKKHFTMRVCLEKGKQCQQGYVFCYTGQLDKGNNLNVKPQFQLTNSNPSKSTEKDCQKVMNASGIQHGFTIGANVNDDGVYSIWIAFSFSEITTYFNLPEDRCFDIHFGGEDTLLTTVTTTSNTPINFTQRYVQKPLPDTKNGGLLHEAYTPLSLLFMNMAVFQSDNDLWISTYGRDSDCGINARILSVDNVKLCKGFFMEMHRSSEAELIGDWSIENIGQNTLELIINHTKIILDDEPLKVFMKKFQDPKYVEELKPNDDPNSVRNQLWFYCNGSLIPQLSIPSNDVMPTTSDFTEKTKSKSESITTTTPNVILKMPLPKLAVRTPNSTALPKLIHLPRKFAGLAIPREVVNGDANLVDDSTTGAPNGSIIAG